MPKGYRSYLPEQELLLPPSLREWLPENHLVYFVSDVVDQLDLSAIHAVYEKEKRGQPPYDPRLMTKILVYGYCTGVLGSRRIQKRVREDIPLRALGVRNERSEERRVGKECRYRWSPYHCEKNQSSP